MQFDPEDYEKVEKCPLCKSKNNNFQYSLNDGLCDVLKCKACGLYYTNYWLSKKGLEKYWSNYLSNVHHNDQDAFNKRQIMYQIDYDFIKNYLPKKARILDIGCSEGLFLDFFKKDGHECYGVEFGKEAAIASSKKFKIFYGNFPELLINDTYDLIIYRGVLQYIHEPDIYLNKTISLLNEGGLIYIIQPNMASFCHRLFKEKFSLPLSVTDCIGYDKHVLENFFGNRCININEQYFYSETPYADIEQDVLRVADAINKARSGEKTTRIGPPFYENMLSIIFKKNNQFYAVKD